MMAGDAFPVTLMTMLLDRAMYAASVTKFPMQFNHGDGMDSPIYEPTP